MFSVVFLIALVFGQVRVSAGRSLTHINRRQGPIHSSEVASALLDSNSLAKAVAGQEDKLTQ
ncbi:hypothetical protein HDV02_000369 [Globomyces sp. JEL0801]|nr:hypothetical protein HDV02_000369 [Globomyces sp. JEL0801]